MRIQALDVARGVAILGTLATNIWIITHPAGMVGYLANRSLPTPLPVGRSSSERRWRWPTGSSWRC